MRQGTTKGSQNLTNQISREAAEFVALDASLNPDHEPGAIWKSVSSDPRFKNLVHTAIEHGNKKYRGLDTAAIVGYEGFIEGVSFAVEVIRQAVKESDADSSLINLLESTQEPHER